MSPDRRRLLTPACVMAGFAFGNLAAAAVSTWIGRPNWAHLALGAFFSVLALALLWCMRATP